MRIFAFAAFFGALIFCPLAAHAQDNAGDGAWHYGIALHGEPKYPEGFTHVDYVNPDAPKGGTLRRGQMGTFDSLNPFIIKGVPAAGLNLLGSSILYESLMMNSADEPFSLYGVIADGVMVAPDKTWVKFKINPKARWQDGTPITSADVIWTFETLMKNGRPFYKAYWHDVESVVPDGDQIVTFNFSVKGNAELPLIIAQLPVLPKHYWGADGHDFTKTTLEPPLGSGPYKIGKVDPGRSIEYVRDPDWWGKDLPLFKGMYNFDKIIYDYYRDEDVMHEAFLSGAFDAKEENHQKRWMESYDTPAVKSGEIVKEVLDNHSPEGMQAYVYNIRRPLFQDIKVREALSYAMDFEWSNKQFAYGQYVRTDSFFENSELASSGLPSDAELKILDPYRGKIPDAVFTSVYSPPTTDGSGNDRANLKKAVALLKEAGYTQLGKDGVRFRIDKNGKVQRLSFEILYFSNSFERWVMPFIANLKKIGVEATFRVVDPSQYQNRMDSFDFDMTIQSFGQSESPGNEQREFWGSDRADMKGSRNIIGIKDPVIDDLVTQLIHATSREDLVTKTRALDRVLLWRHYVIPMWHYPKWRVAYWAKLKRPEHLSNQSPLITTTWWRADAGAGSAGKKE